MKYGGAAACGGCRQRYGVRQQPVPCETEKGCPFDPSPGGDGQVSARNAQAWWLWERLEALGPQALDLAPLALTPLEAEHLIDKLAYLRALAVAHRREAQSHMK